jgi:hypothetical protein
MPAEIRLLQQEICLLRYACCNNLLLLLLQERFVHMLGMCL